MKKITYIADLHGHSYYSDGKCSPKEIIQIALRNGVSIIALTDNNTTKGLKEFEEGINEHRQEILGIYGIEITTNLGHVIFLFGTPEKASEFSKGIKKRDILDYKYLFDRARKFDTYIIIPHPEIPFIHSLKFEDVDKILKEYPDLIHRIGLEEINGYSLIMPPQLLKKHRSLSEINKEKGWNRKLFGNSDFHMPYGIGVGFTVLESKNKITSAKQFITDIQNGNTSGKVTIKKSFALPQRIVAYIDAIVGSYKYQRSK